MLTEVMRYRLSLLLALFPLFAPAPGCATCNPGGQDAIRYEEGEVLASGDVYQTTGVYDEMLHFPSGRRYDLVHGLGKVPHTVKSYVSFVPQLSASGDKSDLTRPNNIAESAGNQVVIERWDDEVVRIRNDTCIQDFYVRIVIEADADASSGLGGAAGMSGSADMSGSP